MRVQRRIACTVNAEIPIDAVCSVDELCCVLDARDGAALGRLWAAFEADGLSVDRLATVQAQQGELFARSGPGRENAATLSEAIDTLNKRYGRTVIGFGQCRDASSASDGYAGAKIAYGRIPNITPLPSSSRLVGQDSELTRH